MISFFTLAQKKKKKRWKKKEKKKKGGRAALPSMGKWKRVNSAASCVSEQVREAERHSSLLPSIRRHLNITDQRGSRTFHWAHTNIMQIHMNKFRHLHRSDVCVITRLLAHSQFPHSAMCVCVCVCVRRGICGQRAGICSRLGQTGFSPTAAKLQLPALRWKQPPLPHPNTTNNC